MIKTKKDLINYVKLDKKRFDNRAPNFKDRILHNECWYIYKYILHIRYLEYYKNNNNSIWHKIKYLYHFYFYKKLSFITKLTIYPGTVGPGLRIYHIGSFLHIGKNVKIGKNCTLVSGVIFGNKNETDDCKISVGDNCYFGADCKILGNVNIGDNVIIGANTVITKDIPDNAVVGGVPGHIIRFQRQIL